MSLKGILFRMAVVGALFAGAACDDPLALQPATIPNVIDTLQLSALQGTPIDAESAFDLVGERAVRTDRGDQFDFAFDLDASDLARIFPTGALGLGTESAIAIMDERFEDIDIAPDDGYELDSAVTVDLDVVFVVRSRPSTGAGFVGQCPFFIGALPRYGKFRVLAIDLQDRTITFETLVNLNCGYRGLALGLPDR